MAHLSSSSSSSSSSLQEQDNPDLESTSSIAVSINECILDLVTNAESWISLKQKSTSRFIIQKQNSSVLSNLYWGIESIEAAIQSKCQEEKTSQLRNSERMLQTPALLDEHGFTEGVPNRILVSFAYFYLSIVGSLQGNAWRSASHFLQSLLVSPRLVQRRIAPEICKRVFSLLTKSETQKLSEYNNDEEIRRIARRYKHCLTYYQIMSSGGNSCLPHQGENYRHATSGTADDSEPDKQQISQQYCEVNKNLIIAKTEASEKIQGAQECYKPFANVNQTLNNNDYCSKLEGNAKRRRLRDMLNESQSDISTPICDYGEEDDTLVNQISSASCSVRNTVPPKKSWNFHKEDTSSPKKLELEEHLVLGHRKSTCLNQKCFNQASFAGTRHIKKRHGRVRERAYKRDLWENLEKIISTRCLSEVIRSFDEDRGIIEITTVFETLKKNNRAKYTLLEDVILDELVVVISSSKEKKAVRASICMLTTIISRNKSAVEDVKKKGLRLNDLANALKQQNVQEAAVLIYLIKPSPMEIKRLELLPVLVEVASTSVCYKGMPKTVVMTPPAASLMILEVLVTAFDCTTNNMHLAAISSPSVLSGILRVAELRNVEEFVSLASILIKCVQFDGKCRKYVSQFVQVGPFMNILQSSEKRHKFIVLEFFHEILCVPRSSAIKMLQQMRKEAKFDVTETLLLCIKQTQSHHKLLSSNLLLQFNAIDYSSGINTFSKDAMEAILNAVTCSEDPNMQLLSSFVLSNLGGTYSWTGQPYTVSWLVKKTGLCLSSHRNMIRHSHWSDHCLQDPEIDGWCSKMARSIIDIDNGKHTFHALQKGLKSKNKTVSRECLTTIAWLSFEIARSSDSIKYSAHDILLDDIQQLLHPGVELQERLLACLCIYNFASGKGMQKIMQLSEGVRESLRRLSHVTWMADELHKVTDYLVNKSRISCVHTQTLEIRQSGSGAVTALIYYKGLLCSGYSDGSIKVWDIKRQVATLVWDIKEHTSAVSCFAHYEQGESLLSGSLDKTIRIWKIIDRKMECIEVITTKEPIQKIDSYGKLIFVITKGHKMKVIESSNTLKGICKSKSVKCMTIFRGKVYIGCTDSSIQELTIANNQEREIKASTRSWRIQNKPITSIIVYREWLYSSSTHVEGSPIKELRRNCEPQMSISAEKGANVLAMGVVEDFIYLNRSSSPTVLQVWLRRTQQKVGRLSAGSKVTSLLTANDMVLCGTQLGVIKGWIPL